jgi:hypothetical protein
MPDRFFKSFSQHQPGFGKSSCIYGNQGGTPACSVRKGKYKLIRFFEDKHLELYDLEKDLSERDDLSIALPDLAANLNGLLSEWLKDVCAKIPEINPDWTP